MRRSRKILTLLRIQFEWANQKKEIFGRYQSYKRRNLKKPRSSGDENAFRREQRLLRAQSAFAVSYGGIWGYVLNTKIILFHNSFLFHLVTCNEFSRLFNPASQYGVKLTQRPISFSDQMHGAQALHTNSPQANKMTN